MRLPPQEYLRSRGWDLLREEPDPGGVKRVWKSRRTGEELSTEKATSAQRKRDFAEQKPRESA